MSVQNPGETADEWHQRQLAERDAEEKEHNRRRRNGQKAELLPILAAIIANGHVRANPSEKASVIAKKSLEVVDHIFALVEQRDG